MSILAWVGPEPENGLRKAERLSKYLLLPLLPWTVWLSSIAVGSVAWAYHAPWLYWAWAASLVSFFWLIGSKESERRVRAQMNLDGKHFPSPEKRERILEKLVEVRRRREK